MDFARPPPFLLSPVSSSHPFAQYTLVRVAIRRFEVYLIPLVNVTELGGKPESRPENQKSNPAAPIPHNASKIAGDIAKLRLVAT